MGEFADKLKEQNHSDQMVSSVAVAEDIAMGISGAQAYYGSAKALGAQLGLWEADDPLQAVMDALEELKKAIDAAREALLNDSFERALDDLAQTHLMLSQASLNALNLLRAAADGNLTEDEIRVDVTRDMGADHYLYDGSWKVLSYPGAFYDDPWSGTLAPPLEPGERVFVFMIVAPGYMAALARWLIAYAAVFDDPFTGNIKEVVAQHVDRIVELHEKWRSGIYRLRIPTLQELLPTPRLMVPFPRPGDRWTLLPAAWDSAVRWYGAVDSFSVVASTESYSGDIPTPPDPADYLLHLEGLPPPEPAGVGLGSGTPPRNPSAPDDPPLVTDDYKKAFDTFRADVAVNFYPLFARRLRAVSLRESKVVYNHLPLANMWRMQNTMREMIGAGPIRVPGSPGHWSLREFDAVIREDEPFDGSLEDVIDILADALEARTISVRELNARMGQLPFGPISLRAVFQDPEHRVA